MLYWQPVSVGSARLTRSGLPGHPSLRPSSHSFPNDFLLTTFVHSSICSRHRFRIYPSCSYLRRIVDTIAALKGNPSPFRTDRSNSSRVSSYWNPTAYVRFHSTVFSANVKISQFNEFHLTLLNERLSPMIIAVESSISTVINLNLYERERKKEIKINREITAKTGNNNRRRSKKFKLIYKLIYIFLKLTSGPYFSLKRFLAMILIFPSENIWFDIFFLMLFIIRKVIPRIKMCAYTPQSLLLFLLY